MKVIVAGSRKIADYSLLCEVMNNCGFIVTEVVSGGARGVDKLGEDYAQETQKPIKKFPARWGDIEAPGAIIRHNEYGKPYNKRAGLTRNEEMAAYADALVALWDGKSAGTRHMIETMKKLGKPVYVHLEAK